MVFVTIPLILSRYRLEDFSVYSYFIATISVLSVIMSFKRDSMVVQVEAEKLSKLFSVTTIWIVMVAFLVVVVLYLFPDFISPASNDYRQGVNQNYLASLFAIGAVCFTLGLFYTQLAIRENKERYVAKGRLLQASCMLLFQWYFAKSGGYPLIEGYILSWIVFSVYILCGVNSFPITFTGLSKVTYKDFTDNISELGWLTASTFCSKFIQAVGLIVLVHTYGTIATAGYALAQRLVMAPFTIISGSVGSIFLLRFSELNKTTGVSLAHLTRYILALLVFWCIGAYAIYCFMPLLVSNFFDEEWQSSLPIIPIFCLLIVFRGVALPISSYLHISGGAKFYLGSQVAGIAFMFIAYKFSAATEYIVMIWSVSIAEILSYVLLVLIVLKKNSADRNSRKN